MTKYRIKVHRTVPRPRWHFVCGTCGTNDTRWKYTGPWRSRPWRAKRDGRKHVRGVHEVYDHGSVLGESENQRKARA